MAAVATAGWAPLGLAQRLSIYPFLLYRVLLGGWLLRTPARPPP
ncbi:hypothetical protein [Allobranchiibius sp. GilTou38]|nr:hypothetical protein [Allobranchiibius sp. GilTou38]